VNLKSIMARAVVDGFGAILTARAQKSVGGTSRLRVLAAACALLGLTASANASPYVVTLHEVGSDVVATGAGEFDLTGLQFLGASTSLPPEVDAPLPRIVTGIGGQMNLYGGATGPTTFGTGSEHDASSGTGDSVGVSDQALLILVPIGYTSTDPLSDSAIYLGATFASLGVTPGTYKWTWGNGADQSFTLEIGQTPIPAALPLFATGLGSLGLLGWRRRRKAAVVA